MGHVKTGASEDFEQLGRGVMSDQIDQFLEHRGSFAPGCDRLKQMERTEVPFSDTSESRWLRRLRPARWLVWVGGVGRGGSRHRGVQSGEIHSGSHLSVGT